MGKKLFDYIIGNPPYQEDRRGESNTALPVYHNFMEAVYEVGTVVELITPARFLFNAGRTPKTWNSKMLNDEHLKVLKYESDASKTIFPGGFCIPGVRKNFITADGKIIVCEKVDERQELFQIGDIYNGIDMERINKLIDATEKRLNKCKHCWAARFCNICFMDVLSMGQEYCEKSKLNIEKELGYYISRVSPDRDLVNYIANISLI